MDIYNSIHMQQTQGPSQRRRSYLICLSKNLKIYDISLNYKIKTNQYYVTSALQKDYICNECL